MESKHTQLLVETIASHFPAARVEGATVWPGFGELSIECEVNSVRETGGPKSASLFFRLRGGRLGDVPVFASMNGYEATTQDAIITGACHWACSFGPVLRAGLADEEMEDLDSFDVVVTGRRFRAFVAGLDRAILEDGKAEDPEPWREARRRLGGDPWLCRRVLESGAMPILPAAATVLSVFAWDQHDRRVVEVKINGRDWVPAGDCIANRPAAAAGAVVLMRELVVLRPIDARTTITAPDLEVTMEGLRAHEGATAISWRGWRNHGGSLRKPLQGHELATLEETCVLPDDYRRFLTGVAGSGAGPGYGLLSPLGTAQAALARGSFAWTHEQQAPPDTGGVIALAHAGCGVMWLLVVEGVHRGEVWLDARGSDGAVRRVAPTFSDWYAAWLDAAVRDAAPWTQWDASSCSTPHAFSSYLDANPPTGDGPPLAGKLNAAALRVSSLGETYFERGAPLDPCHACVLLAERLGAPEEVFAPGNDPRPGSDAGKRSGGLFGRLSKHLRRPR